MLKFMRNKILIPLLIMGALAAFFSFKYTAAKSRTSEDKRKLVIETIMKTIQTAHFSPRAIDDTFSARVYHKILTQFDYDKLFFQREDVNKLNAYEFKIDDEIKVGSIEFFDTFDAIYLRRTAAAEKYYAKILSKPFTFNTDETMHVNAEKDEYAANETEMSERWRQHLKYRVLEKYVPLKTEQDKKRANKDSVKAKFKTDGELEAQAREEVKKFYDRVFKRIHKFKDDERFIAYVNMIAITEDPHTYYFPPRDKKDFEANMSGSFVGIGARLKPEEDKTTVSSIIIGSPAWKQGELKAGDEIIKVAQGEKTPVDVQGMELNDVIDLIRGPKGTEVRLTVKRPEGIIKVIPIKRDVIEIEETFAKSAIIKGNEGPIGYIYLPEFYADFNHTSGRSCATDVAIEVKKLKEAGVKGIILDLRYNGGGSLGDVVDMAGIFIGKGPVVQVKSNRAAPTVLRANSYDSALYSGPLAIMVNENSASASEILAAVLQDYKRAVVVGAMTYGKGTVQKMVDLDQVLDPMTRLQIANDTAGMIGASLGSLKLTMEKFYRVNGGSTQLKGVIPDVIIPDIYDSYDDEELGERNNKSALAWDEIAPANYKPTGSLGNISQITELSKSRINANPTFKVIQERSEYIKKRRIDNTVSLNEAKYKKDLEEMNAITQKQEDLAKKATVLEMTNISADLTRINADTASITKNKEWLKNVGKDIYVAETVNILNDLPKSGMKVSMGTGLK